MQALDSRLDQLAHRRRNLPELAEITELTRQASQLRDQVVGVETEIGDADREQARFEADIEQVRVRKDRDQQRLDAGQVSSPRELGILQSEIVSLQRRQAELEEAELEIMERVETAQARLADLRSGLAATEERLTDVQRRRDTSFAEIDAEAERAHGGRASMTTDVPGDLLELYEKLRAHHGGTGAAALRQGRCEGCRLELTPTDLARIRSAPPQAVLRCEECRRILVRTPESGL